MKKIFLFLIVAMMYTNFSNAQSMSGGFRRAGTNAQIKAMQKNKLKDSLGLTTEQANRVDAIQQDYMLRMRAVRMNSQISNQEKTIQLNNIKEERKEKLSTFLSNQQIAKLDGKMNKPVKRKMNKKYNTSAKKANKSERLKHEQ